MGNTIYDKLTIKQHQEMNSYVDEFTLPIERGIAKVAYLEGSTVEELMSLTGRQYHNVYKKYKGIDQDIKPVIPTMFQDYKIILDLRDLTIGDFADFMELIKQGADKNLSKIIAKLWTSPLPFEERSRIIYENMLASHAIGLNGFFLAYCEIYERNMLLYLERTIRRLKRRERLTHFLGTIRGRIGLIYYRVATIFGGSKPKKYHYTEH